ncbi:hypothetical protein BH24ACT5_BH24ACT5_29660 [soil metagenome]
MLRLSTARSLRTTARLDRPSSCHPYLPIAPARASDPVGHVGTVAPVSGPRVDQINVVVGDVAAAARFLVGLDVDLPSTMPEWETHHRSIPAATSQREGHDLVEPTFGIDLDSGVFAQRWGGLAPSFAGVVLNLRVHERAEVDQLHDLALSLAGPVARDAVRRVLGISLRRGRRPRATHRGPHERARPRAPQRPARSSHVRLIQHLRPAAATRQRRASACLDRSCSSSPTSPKCRAGAALSAAPNSAGE